MNKISWSKPALADITAIGEFVEQSSAAYAKVLISRLYGAVETLAEFPLMGREVPEIQVPHIREIVRDGYRIVYVTSDGWIEILAVLHSRQDLEKKLRRE